MSDIPSNELISINELNNYSWKEVWNALYYSFINKNKKKLKNNYGTASQVAHWNNKTTKEKNELLALAKKYKNLIKKY